MKEYVTPEIEIIKFGTEQITAKGDSEDGYESSDFSDDPNAWA